MGKFLYVGGFVLPDRNAAAQRVMSIAKSLKEIGHEVIFLNYSDNSEGNAWKIYNGFSCYEKPKANLFDRLVSVRDVKKIIEENKITSVVAYNYPAVALYRLLMLCKRKSISCYMDAAEWYVAKGNIIFKLIKTIDTELRMRYLHPKSDGVIAISDYLYRYYRDKVKTVKIPPTVDIEEAKWRIPPVKNGEQKTVFVYAGSPTLQKERLDFILDAVGKVIGQRDLIVRIIGITQQQYEQIYGKCVLADCVEFLGRISHTEVIRQIKSADGR